MSVYVGIDVHRKRSQVEVVAEDGQVQLNKNTVNGTEPLLRLIGDLPAGTPVASGAASGWSWLADLLEDYGFEAHLVHPLRCKAIASARGEERQGPAPPSWRSCCARTCCPRRSSPRRRSASSAP
jgi:transposase